MDLDRLVGPGVRALHAYSLSTLEPHAVRLKDNENPLPLDRTLMDKLLAPLASIDFNRYPDSHQRLREAIAAKYNWQADGVMLGNGSDEIIQILLITFSNGPVLIHRPTFVMYEHLSRALGRELRLLDLEPDSWDIPAGTSQAGADAALSFLASPNNPTGNLYTRERIEELCRRASGLVILDEAYAKYSGQSCRELLATYDNICLMDTFSKVGLAGLRLGFLLARPEVVAYLDRVRLPYNVNAAVAAMGLAYVENVSDAALVEPVIAARQSLAGALAALGLRVFPSAANFIFCASRHSREIAAQLRDQDIWIRSWDQGPLRNYCRITVGTTSENEKLLAALPKIIAAL